MKKTSSQGGNYSPRSILYSVESVLHMTLRNENRTLDDQYVLLFSFSLRIQTAHVLRHHTEYTIQRIEYGIK